MNMKMEVTKQMLQQMIEQIDESKFNELFCILMGMYPEDDPLPDEIEAINRSEELAEEDFVDFDTN